MQEDPRRFRVGGEMFGVVRDDRGVGLAEHESIARQRDRRRHHRGARQPPVAGQRQVEALDRAGHRDGAVAVKARVADRVAGGIEIHARRRRLRRGLAEIDERVAALVPRGGSA
jgi:hypothetical protein